MVVLPVKNTTTEEEQDFLEVWREQATQLQKEQETLRALARASVRAYVGFVDSLFAYYRNVRAEEEVKDVDKDEGCKGQPRERKLAQGSD